MMIGSTAVIATTSAGGGDIGVFTLDAKAVDQITEVDGAIAARRRLSQAAVTLTEVRPPPVSPSLGVCAAGFA